MEYFPCKWICSIGVKFQKNDRDQKIRRKISRGCSAEIILIYFALYLACLAFSEMQRSDSTLVVHVFGELQRNQPPTKHLEGFGENGALIRILRSRSLILRKTWPSGNLQKCSAFWQLFDNPSASNPYLFTITYRIHSDKRRNSRLQIR